MEHATDVLFSLFLMFTGAKLMAEAFERLRQPAVIGEILAGVLLGPFVLDMVRPSEVTAGIAEIGVIFLLFTVGLETKPRELLEVGWTAGLVAVLGVVLPFLGGFGYMALTGHTGLESIFIGTALVATSVGITARVLADMGFLHSQVARIILGAAVVDDILGMILLAVVSSLSAGEIHYLQIFLVVLEAIGFTAFVAVFGTHIIQKAQPRVEQMVTRNSPFILSIILCLGLSAGAAYVGMAAIIGSFLAGLALADRSEEWHLQRQVHGLYEFMVPFFFVVMGIQLDLGSFSRGDILMTASIVTAIAMLTKLVGCTLGAMKLGMRKAGLIGTGMIPRGEVGIIVALVGLKMGTLSTDTYGIVLFMSVATTLVAPAALRILLRRTAPETM
jgi:Kef-type K+ transport system membrane component KefB